jgi:alpha-D-xyloside xylohydrolase
MSLSDGVTLVMRLYNDGVAFRYEGKAISAKKELTTFRIPEGTKRWMEQWADSYEGFFPLSTTAKVKALPSFSAVAKDAEGHNIRWAYPLLMEPANGIFAMITEANIERGHSASCLYNNGELFRVVPDEVFDGQTVEHTPWRVVIIGKLSDVVESTLVTDVSEPCKLKDVSWIQPGVVSWVYWAYNHGSNDFNIIKKYVDLAVALHLPYVLIDAEWDEMPKMQSNGGKTIEDAVAYAKSQGIRPMIWYNSSVGWVDGAPTPKYRLNKAEDREKEFAWCERLGVAGVKIDFFSGDSQKNMDFCLDLLESAARHHLLVNFHGATIPRGWQRTYPNLLSTEGVYGAEWYNNVGTFTAKAAAHNATLPFTRNVIGPMDYTPCAFSDSQHPHITTHAHELALTVLFESGLQHLADRPESFLSQPVEVQRFFSELPTAWDETRYVSGYPGESVVLARRKGNTWYVAGINGSDETKTLRVPLDFIDKKHGRVEVFADDGDRSWKLSTVQTIPSTATCLPRGGFVWVIHPKGTFVVRQLSQNAVRIQYQENVKPSSLPEWIYVKNDVVKSKRMKVAVDNDRECVTITDKQGRVVFEATRHQLLGSEATLAFRSAKDEHLYGLGQFQDGYTNVRGLSRRLTQVNTQISIPMLLSDKGYGVLWNNYGLTEFNPCGNSVRLQESTSNNATVEVVNVTSTEGGKQEVRQRNIFEAVIDVPENGEYSLLLDVGQKMARRHNLSIDGQTVIEMQNLWLPPTTSTIVRLQAGRHVVKAELSKGDNPTLYYNKVKDETVFRSPVAEAVDYTVFIGSPDEIIASYREVTGKAPIMPSWALGYIHCRERFHSSDEILQTANRFRSEQLPLSLIVQDWQYWGKYGWNSMQFDERFYPDPKALTDSLHRMGIRLMVSVWSKIDKNSEVGRQMLADNNYIPGTDWIDFFNPDAAAAYWKNFSDRLVPLGIDAWWQDATEPENDDLAGRRVNNGKWSGEQVRNVYPLLVNKTVYEGLAGISGSPGISGKFGKSGISGISGKTSLPISSPMILTRCGFPGIQRYGSALWSGDVGNDWETFRRQITAGLGVQAAGIPWWTYDAGGFFRPGDQYTNQDYIERMLRWIETSVYLPLMRVHGYMSNTEPWNYGPKAQAVIAQCLKEREQLRPYIEQCAEDISTKGYTLMRPLVFDFADDPQALQQKYEYMFGPSLLVSPVTEPHVTQWQTYLPKNKEGWTDFRTGKHYEGGQTVTTDAHRIPVFVREGSRLQKLLPTIIKQ